MRGVSEPVIPTGRELVTVVLKRLAEGHSYDAGVNGTCYECPFASVPLERSGREAVWSEISNDPTEAYFRCYLPGRDAPNPAWGEYAPCDVRDWTGAALAAHLGDAAPGEVRVWPQDGATDVTWHHEPIRPGG